MNKPPWEWQEADIEELFRDGIKESLTLEYKRIDALDSKDKPRTELSKDVSAFANSAGGTLVYGVIENKDTHRPIGFDTGCDPSEISKETIEQVINSTIHRRISGVRIQMVELTRHAPGRVAYVIYVPQSDQAPHMASDHKFYRRFNFTSVPMEEYEVRDVAHRSKGPLLEIGLFIKEPPFSESGPANIPAHRLLTLGVSIANHSLVPAMYAIVHLYFDQRLSVENSNLFVRHGLQEVPENPPGPWSVMHTCSFNLGIPSHMPIWQGTPMELLASPLLIRVQNQMESNIFLLGWAVESIDMPRQQRMVFLHQEQGHAFVSLTS